MCPSAVFCVEAILLAILFLKAEKELATRPAGLSLPTESRAGQGRRRPLSRAVLQVPVAEREDAAPEVPARAFRVVCDNMLQGLARSLRCLGADVRVLGTNEDHRRAAEVSVAGLRAHPAGARGPSLPLSAGSRGCVSSCHGAPAA